jgi:hypothetical protein
MKRVFVACRRILDMVRVLHLKGYECLRINPGMSPSGGYWRCEFLAGSMTLTGTVEFDEAGRVETAKYTSGQERKYFGWSDAASDLPEKLAAKFVVRFPELSAKCVGRDQEYVEWYAKMLQDTNPVGFIYSYADYPLPDDYLPVQNMPDMKIPPPPRWRG